MGVKRWKIMIRPASSTERVITEDRDLAEHEAEIAKDLKSYSGMHAHVKVVARMAFPLAKLDGRCRGPALLVTRGE